MKIGFLGKMASGKTTMSNYILNLDNEYKIYSFGDKVKDIAQDLFNMENKDRKLLQSIGEKMREIDSNVWVNYLISQINNSDKDKIIVDDVRYENEIQALKNAGFIIIYLDLDDETQQFRLRNKYKNYQDHVQNLNHSSERADELKHLADYKINTEISDTELNKFILKILSLDI